MTQLRVFFRYALRRIQHLLYRLLNFLSFGFIRLPAGSYLSDYYIPSTGTGSHSNLAAASATGFNSSSGCLSSNSSDSEGELSLSASASPSSPFPRTRRRSPRTSLTEPAVSAVAQEAVAHSYEDITRPDYHNYLWLTSRWDRTELAGAGYFVGSWVETLRSGAGSGDGNGDENGSGDGNGDGNGSGNARIDKDMEKDIDTKDMDIKGMDIDIDPTHHTTQNKLTKRKAASEKTCKMFLHFLRRLSSLPDSFFPRRRIILPKKQKTLVLDLDETLIHSTAASCVGFDFMIEVLISRTSCLYYVYKRPHVDYFLEVVRGE